MSTATSLRFLISALIAAVTTAGTGPASGSVRLSGWPGTTLCTWNCGSSELCSSRGAAIVAACAACRTAGSLNIRGSTSGASSFFGTRIRHASWYQPVTM